MRYDHFAYDILDMRRMPKKYQKSNEGEVAEDFDDMLAGFRAADLANAPSSHVASSAAEATHANVARAQTSDVTVPASTIVAAMRAGDLSKLRRWHRQGVKWSTEHLCEATQLSSLAVMRCLIELGADVNGADAKGFTPVFLASQYRYLGLVQYLIRTLGVDVNKADAKGASPLYVAAQNGHLEVVRCLLNDLGADVNQATIDGTTSLIIAAANGHLAMVRCLGRKQGANINQASTIGITALLFAAWDGHLDVVKCLVGELGADVNLAMNDGYTALMLASHNKHDKVIRWLARNGADVQVSTRLGTAVDASKAGGAPIAQTEYREAKEHCSNPWCSGAGLKKCTGCKQARYCGETCQQAHWKVHTADCKPGDKV
jgi:ankyrin repeat protein